MSTIRGRKRRERGRDGKRGVHGEWGTCYFPSGRSIITSKK